MDTVLAVPDTSVVGAQLLCYKDQEATWINKQEQPALQMDLSDEELVELAKDGDRRAFEELVVRHQERAYSLALHMCWGIPWKLKISPRKPFCGHFEISGISGETQHFIPGFLGSW